MAFAFTVYHTQSIHAQLVFGSIALNAPTYHGCVYVETLILCDGVSLSGACPSLVSADTSCQACLRVCVKAGCYCLVCAHQHKYYVLPDSQTMIALHACHAGLKTCHSVCGLVCHVVDLTSQVYVRCGAGGDEMKHGSWTWASHMTHPCACPWLHLLCLCACGQAPFATQAARLPGNCHLQPERHAFLHCQLHVGADRQHSLACLQLWACGSLIEGGLIAGLRYQQQ